MKPYKSTALCILFYSGVSTYVRLYRSGLFNFGSYVSFPNLFACFLGFDIHTSSFTFIENVFYLRDESNCEFANQYKGGGITAGCIILGDFVHQPNFRHHCGSVMSLLRCLDLIPFFVITG